MNINELLKVAVENKASDLHIKVGSPPVVRVDGTLKPLTEMKRLMQEDTVSMAFSMMNARQKQRFKEELDLDIAYSVPGPRVAFVAISSSSAARLAWSCVSFQLGSCRSES